MISTNRKLSRNGAGAIFGLNKDIEDVGTWEEYLAAAKVMVVWTELIEDAEGVIFGTAVVR